MLVSITCFFGVIGESVIYFVLKETGHELSDSWSNSYAN
jgi:hypothetical protein